MNIVVVGNLNMDLVDWIPKIPKLGEILLRVFSNRFRVVRAQPLLPRREEFEQFMRKRNKSQ